MNITEKTVAKLTPGKARIQHYDDQQVGFGVRVEISGRKSFFWLQKVSGKPRFRALGDYPQTTVSEARAAATVWAGAAATWKQNKYTGADPFERAPRVAPPSNVPTFRELFEAYIEQHVRVKANNPVRAEYQCRWRMKRHFATWLDRPMDTIGIEDVLTSKRACGAKHSLANRCVEQVSALYNWSGKMHDGKVNFWPVEKNPAAGVDSFEEAERDRYLEPDELGRFNEALKTEKHRDLKDFLTLAMATAARKSDIFGMRWSDIKWEREAWVVPFPKNGESYDVQLLPVALAVLKRRRAEAPDTEKYVFPGTGACGHVRELRDAWEDFRVRAKLENFHVHDVRRTAGAYMAMSGISLQQIGAALGHKSIQSTLVYARLNGEVTREARQSGQQKMQAMMLAAKKRTKGLAGKKAKLALVS